MMMNQLLPSHLRDDLPRAEKRVRVQLQFAVDAGRAIAGQWVRPDENGNAEIVVYESDLKYVKDEVENDESAVKAAHRSYRTQLKRFIAEKAQAKPSVDAIPDDESLWTDEYRRLSNIFPGSPEKCFDEANGRGIRPLRGFTVLEKDLPPPMTMEQAQAKAVYEAQGSSGHEVAQLKAELAELKRLIASQGAKPNKQ